MYLVTCQNGSTQTYVSREHKNNGQFQLVKAAGQASHFPTLEKALEISASFSRKNWYSCSNYEEICKIFGEILERREDGAVFRQQLPGLYTVVAA